MPVINSWLVPEKVIYTDLVGDLSLEDITVGSADVIKHYEESDSDRVHIVADQSKMGSVPISLKAFSDASEFMRHEKLGWFIMFPAGNQFAKFMASMISSLTKVDHRQTESLEEALHTLKRMDNTLPSVEEMLGGVVES